MSEIEKFRMKISTGNEIVDNRSLCNFRKIDLKTVYSIIDEKVADPSLRDALKDKASKYPYDALDSFVRSIDRQLSNIIRRRNNWNYL